MPSLLNLRAAWTRWELSNENNMTPLFTPFPKIARLSREVIITEKIDGTNASIYIMPSFEKPIPYAIHEWYSEEDKLDMVMLAGSRTRWITPESDNYGFAAWAKQHAEELKQLGQGQHFGEWWGQGIQRKYGLTEKRWSLFNVGRWCLHGETPSTISTADPRITKTQDVLPECCHLVPVLHRGEFCTVEADMCVTELFMSGSKAAPGFMCPEGIIVYHIAAGIGFKKTIEKDEQPKGILS